MNHMGSQVATAWVVTMVLAALVFWPGGASSLAARDSVVPPDGGPDVTVEPDPASDDDTERIQKAIDRSRYGVFFKTGRYKFSRSLYLRPGQTYRGEGSWLAGSLLTATRGQPIFTVGGRLSSVTIEGLTFGGPCAKGIASDSSDSSRLVNSVIRGNSFLYDLREGIDASIVSTRIEQNQFGKNGEVGCAGRRHMRIRLAVDDSSLLIDQDQANFLTGNESWIAYNVFHGSIAQVFTARELTLDESLLVTQPSAVRPPFRDRAPRLNLVGNDFEGNFSDTAVRIRGVVRVIVDGNWFERTCGSSHIKLSSESRNRALIASLENNRYGMSGCEGGLRTALWS